MILEIWEFYSSYIRFHEGAFGRMLRYNMNIKRNETDELWRDKRIREVRRIASIMPQLNNKKNRIFFFKRNPLSLHKFLLFMREWDDHITPECIEQYKQREMILVIYPHMHVYYVYSVACLVFIRKKNIICAISVRKSVRCSSTWDVWIQCTLMMMMMMMT